MRYPVRKKKEMASIYLSQKPDFIARAKSIRTHEWVYGYFWTNEIGNFFIKQTVKQGEKFFLEDIEVDGSTVCKFSGINANDGTPVFMEDFVRVAGKGVVCPRDIHDLDDLYRSYYESDVECVLGNAYDDPNLED